MRCWSGTGELVVCSLQLAVRSLLWGECGLVGSLQSAVSMASADTALIETAQLTLRSIRN